jgi:hypothetical protein
LTTGSTHSETNISLLEKSQRFEFITTVCAFDFGCGADLQNMTQE